jgi:short-subunit dehydrogenase
MSKVALIIGAGPGVSLSFGRALMKEGYRVAFASRDLAKLTPLAASIGADPFKVDTVNNDDIVRLFAAVDEFYQVSPDVVLYNASAGHAARGDCGSIEYTQVATAIQISAVGAFVTAQEAGKRMVLNKKGAIFFSGATAGVKGFPRSPVFAMGKFALRGLAQSMYKELSPKGIHVCHFVLDGAIKDLTGHTEVDRVAFTGDAIAQTYMAALAQPAGAWSWEIEVRTKDEKF